MDVLAAVPREDLELVMIIVIRSSCSFLTLNLIYRILKLKIEAGLSYWHFICMRGLTNAYYVV